MKRITTLITSLAMPLMLLAQGWPADYKGVMLQGFYWDSYSDSKWTNLTAQADELSKYFDLIWVPQSGWCNSSTSMGYNDIYWYDQRSAFGTEDELKTMIQTYKAKGTGIIADVVINHRGGASRWTDFPTETNPLDGKTYTMGLSDICSTDEYNTDASAASERNTYGKATGKADTGEDFNGCRDLDHTNSNVQANCKAYTKYLLDYLGYAGFRYDMVKGYSAQYTGIYNAYSNPTYSVGEYWDGNKSKVTSWIAGTTQNGNIQSAAFDFPAKYLMTNNKTNYSAWYNASGALFSDNTYKRYAVTFVDNHDTYRTAYGTGNVFQGDVVAANAWILAIPGTPCVFLPHWQQYKQEIGAMIKVRKAVGVSNTSTITKKTSGTGYLVCEVSGSNGNLVVVIGNETATVTSYISSNYSTYKKVAGVTGKYAYYTNTEVEGSFSVDKASGYYYDKVDVTVMPVGGATVVYTTDGTTPTASSQQITVSTTMTFNSTTTLKVGLLVNGTVKDIETYTYTVTPFKAYDITVYVNCPDWSPLYFYAWDGDGKQLAGNWPGTQATNTVEKGGLTWYYQTFNIASGDYTVNFIFSKKGSPQTVDLTGINTDKYYKLGSLSGTKYEANDVTDQYSSIHAIETDGIGSNPIVRVFSLDGRLLRSMPAQTTKAEALQGLPHGLYIVNGRKVAK